ncbi:MAG: CaiB/BaiF CoA transferase family protein [Dehalococcoidia bacterium]
MAGPLTGMRVLDLTQGDGAPFTAMQLGDAGADVIKVEPIEGDWSRALAGPTNHGDGPLYMAMNRNKRSIALDLESAEGRAVVVELAKRADVLVHSFPHASDAARLGLDYATLERLNPRLVYCDISTVERSGPEAELAETDYTVQARSGLPRFLGRRGEAPLRYGSNYAGVTASLYAVQAILAALYWRQKSGVGQEVATSYLRAMIATQQNYLTSFSDPDDTSSGGFYVSHLEPPAQGMETAGQRVEMGFNYARDPKAIDKLAEWLGVLDEMHEAYPATKERPLGQQDNATLRPLVARELKKKPYAEVYDKMMELGLQWAPVHDYGTLYQDPGILEQDVVRTVDHPVRGTVRQVSPAWQLDQAPAEIRLAPPLLGEHTDEVLREVGYDDARIASLRNAGAVR